MNKKYIRTPEGAKDIIEYNIQRIYRIPDRYHYINLMLKDTRADLLKILQYVKGINPIIWQQKYTWYIDNTTLTSKIRKRTTKATSNRHFNFLCCMGFLNKQKQTTESMIGINREFMLESGSSRAMNVISIYRYTDRELERIEGRAKRLHEKNITAGNISCQKLLADGFKDLANEVFYANNKSMDKREKELSDLLQSMKTLCDADGYTTKKKIIDNMDLAPVEIEKLFRIFKNQIWQQFSYKPPSKEDIEQYNLKNKKWIITKRE